MASFGEQLRAARKAAKVTQAQLAAAIGVSVATVTSWETGRRAPSRDHVIAAADRLAVAANDWLASLGYDLVPDDRAIPLFDRRKPLAVIQEECDSYTWPCLAMNEDFEAVAWNAAANALSELDMGRDLAEPGARNLVRMALSKHYRDKLKNWDAVLTIGMRMYKNGGNDFLKPETLTPYTRALVDYIVANHETDLFRLMKLWTESTPHPEGERSTFVAEWRTKDGTDLRFHCAFTTWSDFDATGGFDWHPADAVTWRWLAARRTATTVAPAPRLAASSARELLRFNRERHGLTQAELAAKAKLSESLISAIESGAKPLTRRTAMTIARAVSLDTSTLNAILEAAGYPAEPGTRMDYLLGHPLAASGRYARFEGQRVHWTEESITCDLERYEWPVLVVDARFEVIATNARCRAAIGLDVRGRTRGPARNLVAIVTDSWFREGVENWAAVVTRILPDDLEIYAMPPGGSRPTKVGAYFRSIVQHVRDREAAAGHTQSVLDELAALWTAEPARRLSTRVSFSLRWASARTPLNFNALITPWNAMIDPYWAIDLHPADAETWESLGKSAESCTRVGD